MQQGNDHGTGEDSADMASNMPNVLSVCGEPATTRIEIYVPRDGVARGHLDGILYACLRHADDILEVIGWAPTGAVTTVRSWLIDSDIHCGSGWDFVAGRAIDPPEVRTEIRHAAADLLGEDHPIVRTVVDALTFSGQVDITDIPRDRAALLLDGWVHGKELTAREREAVLAQFPETAPAPGTEVIEAYELGQTIERKRAEEQAARDWELLERIDRRLRAAKARHAFTLRLLGSGMKDTVWSCLCGESFIELHDDEGDIRDQLAGHLQAAGVRR